MDNPETFCTQFTDQLCTKENCCMDVWKDPEGFLDKNGILVKSKTDAEYIS